MSSVVQQNWKRYHGRPEINQGPWHSENLSVYSSVFLSLSLQAEEGEKHLPNYSFLGLKSRKKEDTGHGSSLTDLFPL